MKNKNQSKSYDASSAQNKSNSLEVFHSKEPIVDKKSIFSASLAPIFKIEDIQTILENLKEMPKIKRATHNIYAYRILHKNGKIDQDFDDDGETGAGSRLLMMMELGKCENVLVVVSRWYGGVHLGAARFKHICNVARELLNERGYIVK